MGKDGKLSSIFKRNAQKSKNWRPNREIRHALENIEAKAAKKGVHFSAKDAHEYSKCRLFAASTDWVVVLREGIHF
eukprot:5998318-Lingulodinium_polyedra.AAC.1